MCGLVSIILKDNSKVLNKEMIDVFKQMLYADALRGWDSTGIACIKGNNDVKVIKDNCSAGPFLFRNPDVQWSYQNRAFIGHNRWATRGSVTAENAHPFTEGDITLAHNGTLKNHYALKNVAVDSHAICHSINDLGAIPTLEKLDGAFALIWYNSKTKEIYATRNAERPLYIVETDDLFILSSEKGLAHWICGRNQMPVRKTTECNAGTLYTFKESKIRRIYFETMKYKLYKPSFLPSPPVTKPAPYVPPTHKALPNNVTAIRPLVEPALHDIAVGDKLEIICWKKTKTQYNNFLLGSIKLEGEALEYPDVTIEVYTDKEDDFEDCVLEVEVHKVYYSAHFDQTTVICKSPRLQKKDEADENGPIVSTNGVKLTNEVLAKVKDNNCVFCAEPFSMLEEDKMSQIVLNPQTSGGHVYRYSYYCPNCADFFSLRHKGHS